MARPGSESDDEHDLACDPDELSLDLNSQNYATLGGLTRDSSAPRHTTGSMPSDSVSWRLGLVTDRHRSVHLGVVFADDATRRPTFIDLLAAVGAPRIEEADLDRLVVLVRGEHLASLRRVIKKCLDDQRIKSRLLELAARSDAQLNTPWPE